MAPSLSSNWNIIDTNDTDYENVDDVNEDASLEPPPPRMMEEDYQQGTISKTTTTTSPSWKQKQHGKGTATRKSAKKNDNNDANGRVMIKLMIGEMACFHPWSCVKQNKSADGGGNDDALQRLKEFAVADWRRNQTVKEKVQCRASSGSDLVVDLFTLDLDEQQQNNTTTTTTSLGYCPVVTWIHTPKDLERAISKLSNNKDSDSSSSPSSSRQLLVYAKIRKQAKKAAGGGGGLVVQPEKKEDDISFSIGKIRIKKNQAKSFGIALFSILVAEFTLCLFVFVASLAWKDSRLDIDRFSNFNHETLVDQNNQVVAMDYEDLQKMMTTVMNGQSQESPPPPRNTAPEANVCQSKNGEASTSFTQGIHKKPNTKTKNDPSPRGGGGRRQCFANRNELRQAVLEYDRDPGNKDTAVARKYGWPMNTWCVDAISDFNRIFKYTTINEDISGWNTENGKNFERMFYGARFFNQDLPWDVSRVHNFKEVFAGATAFQGDISSWNTTNARDMYAMFDQAVSFNGDLSKWNVKKVKSMNAMFRGAVSFQGDLSKWKTTKCTDMSRMFRGATSFQNSVSTWDVKNVKRMDWMFEGAASFNDSLGDWDVSAAKNVRGMFVDAVSFQENLCVWGKKLPHKADTKRMFENAVSCPSRRAPVVAGPVPSPLCFPCFN